MEEKQTLSEKIDKLLKDFEELKQEKKFRLPLKIRMKKGKVRKNWAVVLLLRTNGAAEFKMVPIEDNTIKIGDTYHEATARYVYRYGKYPLIILPEWNITPVSKPEEEVFNPEKDLKKAVEEGKLSAAEKFILHAIKMDLVKQKTKLKITTVLIVIAILGGALILLDYLKII